MNSQDIFAPVCNSIWLDTMQIAKEFPSITKYHWGLLDESLHAWDRYNQIGMNLKLCEQHLQTSFAMIIKHLCVLLHFGSVGEVPIIFLCGICCLL